jgi:FixJ family two-component response regulator
MTTFRCESLQLLIRSEGWQPRTFASAQEFFARPLALVPNCLILDVFLAGLDLQKRASIERPQLRDVEDGRRSKPILADML